MKTYFLSVYAGAMRGGEVCPFGQKLVMVVREETPELARNLAYRNDGFNQIWNDPNLTTCVEINNENMSQVCAAFYMPDME